MQRDSRNHILDQSWIHLGKDFWTFSLWEKHLWQDTKTGKSISNYMLARKIIMIVFRYPMLTIFLRKGENWCTEIMLLLRPHYFKVLEEKSSLPSWVQNCYLNFIEQILLSLGISPHQDRISLRIFPEAPLSLHCLLMEYSHNFQHTALLATISYRHWSPPSVHFGKGADVSYI